MFTKYIKPYLKETINYEEYGWIKTIIFILFTCISISITHYIYKENRNISVTATSVVSGLEYLNNIEDDDALKETLLNAKEELKNRVLEFYKFNIIPEGIYNVEVYSNSKDRKTFLYSLEMKNTEIVYSNKKSIINGTLEFRREFLVITYPLADYFYKVLLPTICMGIFILLLINFFILKIRYNKELLKEIEESVRFKSFCALSGGIAHNFRNDLQVLKGQAKLMRLDANKGPYVRKTVLNRIDKIDPVIDGMISEINTMMSYLNVNVEKILIDINDVINTSIELFSQTHINNNITIKKQMCPKKCMFMGKRHSLITAIINILNNAAQAMSDKKIITIEVYCEKRKCINTDNKIIINIKDTGCGMTEEVKQHIFDPFFTINKAKGTGLGMSTTKDIIQKHGGKIYVSHTKINEGTTITIELPLDDTHE